MEMSDRLKSERLEKGMSQAVFAELANVSKQLIWKIESKKNRNTTHLVRFANILGVTPEWLQFGDDYKKYPDEKEIPKNHIPVLEWNEITEFLNNGTKNLEMSEKNRDFIPTLIIDQPHRKKVFSLKINNDSMISFNPLPSFSKNSFIVCEPRNIALSENYVIAKKMKDVVPIFRQIIKDGDSLFLKPLNPQYKIEEIKNDFLILAVVIAHLDMLI